MWMLSASPVWISVAFSKWPGLRFALERVGEVESQSEQTSPRHATRHVLLRINRSLRAPRALLPYLRTHRLLALLILQWKGGRAELQPQ